MVEPGTLFMAATPLGDIQDASPRLRACLAQAAVVFAEDTRRAGLLLQALKIRRPLRSLHAHNEQQRAAEVVARLQQGDAVAYLSDAGTPAVSDPGAALVAAVHDAGLRVAPVVGPSALAAALSVAGFGGGARSPQPVLFLGFLPTPPAARRAALRQLQAHAGIVVLFESARRLPALLAALCAAQPQRQACLCREMTKTYEQVLRRPLAALQPAADEAPWRGECTLVLGPPPVPPPPPPTAHEAAIAACLAAGVSARDVATCVAALFGVPRREAYARTQALRVDSADVGP